MKTCRLFGALCIAAAVANAQGPAEVRGALATVDALADQGKFTEALTSLTSLLERFSDSDYARAARSEIEMLDARCRFHADYSQPDANDLISGKITVRNRRTELDYSERDWSDFTRHSKSKMYVHEAVLRSGKITVAGTAYTSATFMVCAGPDVGYYVAIGTCPPDPEVRRYSGYGSYMPTQVIRSRGGEREVLYENEWGRGSHERRDEVRGYKKFPIRPDRKFRIELSLSSNQVTVTVNRKRLTRFSKPSDEYGTFGFEIGGEIDEFTVAGQIDPGWIRGKVDAHRKHAFATFRESYRATDHLPAWLFEPIAGGQRARYEGGFPAGQRPGDTDLYERLTASLNERMFLSLLRRTKSISEDEIPRGLVAYFRAMAHLHLGDHEQGLEECAVLLEVDPEYALGWAIQGSLLVEAGRGAEAEKSLEKAIELEPGLNWSYIEYSRHLLRSRRVVDAQVVLDRAVVAGCESPEFDSMNTILLKVRRGPSWPQSFSHRTEHYLIRSDLDERVCRNAGKLLEASLKHYQTYLVRPTASQADTAPFEVYIFSGKAGFESYCRGALGSTPVHCAGLYSPLLKQLLIWNQSDHASTLRTIRHEGLHQYVDSVTDSVPTWLNEGLAEYFEVSTTRLGVPGKGLVLPRNLRALRAMRRSTVPFSTLARMSHARFYQRSQVLYPLSWAWVHFFRHGSKANRAVFEAMLDGCSAGRPWLEVMRESLQDVDLEKLEREFWEYVQELIEKHG